jgi:putative transposase
MARFWRCYYHVIWTTKYRMPLIDIAFEAVLYSSVESKCKELKCQLLAVNSVPDHIHIALSIPPSIAPANVIGQLKGITSFDLNRSFELEERFHWQESYGILTFGEKNMSFVCDYIARQKDHHKNNTTIPRLEKTEEE